MANARTALPRSIALLRHTIDESGTTSSTSEYARFSMVYLGLKPLLLYVHASNAAVLTRWRSHFTVVLQLSEITQDRQLSTASVAGWLKRQQVAGLYIQTHGAYS